MLSRLHSGSVRAKLVAMALATTFAALLTTSISMLVYDLTTFQQNWIDDLTTQAEIVATVSAPAVGFNDPAAARQNLALLRVRPQIQQGAIYAANGAIFAAYAEAGADVPPLPARPGPPGPAVEGGRMVVYHPIMENGERVGTVYLSARYRLMERLVSYATILGVVTMASLLLAAVVATRLQQSITRPLRAVTEVARAVMQRRDFSLRVEHHHDELHGASYPEGGKGARHSGEIGTLVDAFNDMLAEIGRRANALQEANLTLEREMAVRQGAERALLLADRRKDEFLATLAHELRNPLAPLRTGLDIMRLNGGDPAASLRARGVMERQLKQMVRLVDDLLDVSRINTGKLTIRRENLELHAVVANALEIARPFIDAQGHDLAVHLPPGPVHLLGDTTRLAQVLSNLLNNAARYTPHGGHIVLSADVGAEGRLHICVADDGIGIAPGMLADIFEMFVQADASLERSSQGLGVGLSLARRLVELHDGTLEAASEGQGKGSTFTVTLPVLAEVPQAAERPAPGLAGDRHYRILLVDDNEDFVNAIGGLLRTLGHTVHVCHDGPQALAAAEGFAPDFAFLDIGLPGLNGYDLARALRAVPALGRTMMIAVTGWGQQKDRDLAFEAGFEEHLVKPVSVEQILAILAGHREGVAIADR
ncbi:hybrid sensor histidine kinase/response regulator [Pseudoduganella lutea]|uniref:histidine kinase n=1 Tax=Pseudoduganella lutea TaxID=321985 RepID=A0A4P6KT57_9BURK|nr:ATP-binding protein [Pseudoduganella lutea]QBE62080.1 response regulator [Pseudoduganella lutea]